MKKRVLSLLLCFCFLCSAASLAADIDTVEVTDTNTVVPYSEENDPLTASKSGDSVTYTPPQLYANNSSGKESVYSFLTDATYQVPSGYNIFNGIDISKWEGSIDWNAVANAGVDFAFIRVGFRTYQESGSYSEDPNYQANIVGALAAGIPIGVYVYSQAITAEEAQEEANLVLKQIEGYDISLPIVMQYEFYGTEGRLYDADLTASQLTNNCLAFCNTISEAGYTPMIQSNMSFLTDNLDAEKVSSAASIWLAHYTNSTNYAGEYDYWQYSGSGSVDGIDTDVDCNFCITTDNDVVTEPTVAGFSDVYASAWYASAVKFVSDHGLMSGTSDTVFSPNTNLTRAMAAQILYNLSGNPAVTYSSLYSDVPSGKWYTSAVIWANQTGIMSGYGNGKFGVNDAITREQLATTLYNYSEHFGVSLNNKASLSAYTDASSVSSYAVTPMQWAVGNGIISGRSSTTLAPKGKSTRAECAAMLQNYLTGIGSALLP